VILTGVARELNNLRRIMFVVVLCSCAMVWHGYMQVTTGKGWTGLELIEGRIAYAGIFHDPNDLGQLLAISIAFCFYLKDCGSTLQRALNYFAIAWLCYGVYLTNSRGTMLAVLALFGIAGMRRFGGLVAGVFGAVAAIFLAAVTRFGAINSGEQSAHQRIEAWYEGFQMLYHQPLFGVGMNNFTDHHYLTAHNFLILPMAELGLFGFIPWFGLVLFSGVMLRDLIKIGTVTSHVQEPLSGDVDERRAVLGLADMSVAFLVSSFFLSQSYKHTLFICMGLIVARYIKQSESNSVLSGYSVVKNMGTLVSGSAAAIIFMWTVTRILL
jgi:O-antigen ligase